jgi:hypothetical protein
MSYHIIIIFPSLPHDNPLGIMRRKKKEKKEERGRTSQKAKHLLDPAF